ncbi:MAG: YCF48-related protein [Pirellulales bacterium]
MCRMAVSHVVRRLTRKEANMIHARNVLLVALALCASLLCTGRMVAQQTAASPTGLPQLAEVMAEDAELADVFFIDARRGWAIGDRGVIWHTADGGRQWRRQNSGVTCPLSSVWFISSTHGWAVGGATTAYTHATAGVVLHTTDGGQAWTAIPAPMLPALTRVKFFDPQHGVAAGARTAFYPSGVFATIDGGRSWQTMSSGSSGAWLAADFVDPDQGAVAGPGGHFAAIAQREVRSSPLAAPDRRALHAVKLVAPTGGWLVGDGGIVRTTRDLGASWQSPTGDLPSEIARAFDWRSVAIVGSRVWIAGSPGSIVLHSPDNGATWQLQPTGQTTPLRGLAFADAQNGWAVGALGTILATQDGGRTWHLQRAGGRRAALWAALTRPERTPPELIAKHAAAEGYFTAATYLFADDEEATELSASEGPRTREAIARFGGSSADIDWQLPLPPDAASLSPAALQAELDRRTDGQALALLEARMVRDLRMWRPDVVLIEQPATLGGDPAVAILHSAMETAIVAAGDAARYPELAAVGLSPWQPKRLCGVEPPSRPGGLRIPTGDFAATLGCSLAQYVAPSVGLLTRDYTPPPANYNLNVLRSPPQGSGLRRDLFDGLVVNRGSDARRAQSAPAVGELDALRRLAQQRRHMQELLKRTAGNEAWAGQVVNLTGGLDPASGGELLFQLAEGYREAGQLDMAADTYYLLARRYTDHPVVPRALTWLVQYYASGELAHHAANRTAKNARADANLANVPPGVGRDAAPLQKNSAERSAQAQPNSTPQLEATPTGVTLSADDRWKRASLLGQYLEGARPALFAEPSLRFPLAAAHRNLGYTKQSDQFYVIMGKQSGGTAWRDCADAERWLREPDRLPPTKPLATCRTTNERPHLNGVFDEPLWQRAEIVKIGPPVVRGSPDPAPPTTEGLPPDPTTTIRLLRDDEFLYLAITCAKQPSVHYVSSDAPRPRDADLALRDRVALRIDVDRDYTTAYELAVDHNGWTSDRCWGDPHWNPSWFVAAQQTETQWTIEAAIPLSELVELPLPQRSVWALGIERTTPGEGTHCWTGETSPPNSPARFGLLLFE